MTESEWLTSTDPAKMLRYAGTGITENPQNPCSEIVLGFSIISDRKLRLFCCACLASSDASAIALSHSHFAYGEDGENISDPMLISMNWVKSQYEYDPPKEVKCDILRDLVGNPFRKWACGCDPDVGIFECESCHALRSWLTPTVLEIANHAYDNRDFTVLPYLGDALEEAGCTDQRILLHLRGLVRCPMYSLPSGGPLDCTICGAKRSINHGWIPDKSCIHSRGCWVLDLILGKE